MAVDKLQHISDSELIEIYNVIGRKRLDSLSYDLDYEEILVMSAISKRRLTHKTEFKYGLPSKMNSRYGAEEVSKRKKNIEFAKQYYKKYKEEGK